MGSNGFVDGWFVKSSGVERTQMKINKTNGGMSDSSGCDVSHITPCEMYPRVHVKPRIQG